MDDQDSSLHFYFDFISPYAYFAWRQLPEFCKTHGLELKVHPVVFGKLLDHWGQLGPAEIQPKRQWLAAYCMRYAHLNGFDYNPPKFHPYNPLPSLRMALPAVSGKDHARVITRIFEAGWSEGEDLSDPDRLLELLEASGIDCASYSQQINETSVKEGLIAETADAIAKGVFGVPTIIVGDRLFWGNDQFEHIELLLSGKDPVDPGKIAALGKRERAIDRKAFKGSSRNAQ